MRLVFSGKSWDQYLYWEKTDRAMLKKLNALILECMRSPFSGTGKPEALRDNLAGWWSRRIDHEHRLVYRAEGDDLIIAQCRYHYDE